MIIKWGFLSHIAGKRTPGRLNFWKFSGGAFPRTPLEVRAFGPQFYRVPAYSQASALLLQKLMKTLACDPVPIVMGLRLAAGALLKNNTPWSLIYKQAMTFSRQSFLWLLKPYLRNLKRCLKDIRLSCCQTLTGWALSMSSYASWWALGFWFASTA